MLDSGAAAHHVSTRNVGLVSKPCAPIFVTTAGKELVKIDKKGSVLIPIKDGKGSSSSVELRDALVNDSLSVNLVSVARLDRGDMVSRSPRVKHVEDGIGREGGGATPVLTGTAYVGSSFRTDNPCWFNSILRIYSSMRGIRRPHHSISLFLLSYSVFLSGFYIVIHQHRF